MSGGRLARVRTDKPIHINRLDILIPRLPVALDGLRIAHVSDLHIGKLMTPDHLPMMLDAVRAIDGDMIAVTGDFLDLSVGVAGKVVEALKTLEAPLGVHMVMGNHDYLDDGSEFIRQLLGADLGLLLNESLMLKHRGRSICISGIDFAHKPRDLARLVHRTLRRARAEGESRHDLHLLLAHDPNAFRYVDRHGVDLTLAGHTHGGQVILTPQRLGKRPVGPASLAFKFPRGLFKHGDSQLFVTSGIGSWFPLRVNCPPEVAELTLRAARAP
jgi:predicted MPP superfamily phosphohydrolase